MTKTKNERITTLENEVAELKLIVHELRERPQLTTVINNATQGPSTTNTVEDIIEFEGKQYRKVERKAREGDVVIFKKSKIGCVNAGKPYKSNGDTFYDDEGDDICIYNGIADGTPETVDVYELIKEGLNPHIPMIDETIEPLTPNQQRAAIIEKAKAFVKNIVGEYGTFRTTIGKYKDQCVKPIFYVNEKKRAITILIYGAFGKELIFKGLAKCVLGDVFNEHIGKAIALGRALGLDVSEFEQVVQPTVAVGQIASHDDSEVYTITEITTDKALTNPGSFYELSSFEKGGAYIINDTNAIYWEGQ